MMSTTSLDSEELIALVQDRPPLYDVNDPHYHDKDVQDNLWRDVGELLRVTGEEAKRRWRNLRGSFSKSIALDRSLTASNGVLKKRPKGEWYLKNQMNFLLPFMKQSPAAAIYRNRIKHEKDVSEEEIEILPEALLEFSPQSNEDSNHIPQTWTKDVKRIREEQAKDLKDPFVKHVNNPSLCRAFHGHHHFKQSHLDDPDICFFVGLLPEIHQLSESQKRKFKLSVHSYLNSLLEEGPSNVIRPLNSESRSVHTNCIRALKVSDRTMLDTLAALETNSKCSL